MATTDVRHQLLKLPDKAFQGPLLKYKRDYKSMQKRLRRGETGFLTEAEDYATPKVEKYGGEKVTKEDMVKIKEIMAKITKFVIKTGGIIASAVNLVKTFKMVKDGIRWLAELSEKTNLIAAATAPGGAGPLALIAWLKKKSAQVAMGVSYAAGNLLLIVPKQLKGLMNYAAGIVGGFANLYTLYFVGIALRTARAEKWGTASHDDVVRSQQEADDAAAYADDQKNKFIKDVRGSGAFDDSIFQEDEELDVEYEDVVKYDITYGEE